MFDKIADRIAAASEKIPVCPECGPIRRDVPLGSKRTENLRVLCPHQKAEQEEKEREERQIQQYADRRALAIKRYLAIAPPPEQHAALLLAGVEDRQGSRAGLAAAVRYVATWPARLAEGESMTLSGDIGTGKTMVSAAIANEIANLGYSVRFLTVTNLQGRLKDWDAAQETMDDLKRCSLLVLDDFGQERVTEWSSAQLFDLLDARYQSKLPTVLTTNLGARQMREHYIRSLTTGKDQMPQDQAALTVDRVLSRIRQRNVGVVFTGPDQRIGALHAWLTTED